jgi:hypothetical protein
MEILIVLGALAGSYFLGMNIYLTSKNNKLMEELKSASNANYFANDEDKENFLKFISDSREWAFDYIEDVQQGLTKFVKEVEPSIIHFDNYGNALWTPITEDMKIISESFKELKELLPKDTHG